MTTTPTTITDAAHNQMAGTLQHMAARYRRLADELDRAATHIHKAPGRDTMAPHANYITDIVDRVRNTFNQASGVDLINPAVLADLDTAARKAAEK
jgi:hypothetical protein